VCKLLVDFKRQKQPSGEEVVSDRPIFAQMSVGLVETAKTSG
jgi:hypothetical protein